MVQVHVCEAPKCNNAFIPKKGAKKAMYCSPACNQRAYNARLREKRKAQARTLHIDESIHFTRLSELIPELDKALDHYAKIFGNEATMGAIKLIAGIGEALEGRLCEPTTT